MAGALGYYNDDPLGIGLRQRAFEARQAYDAQNRELGWQHGQLVSFSNLGPLADPQWEAWKQAVYESGADKLAGAPGLPNAASGRETTAGEGQMPIDEFERRPAGYAMRSIRRVS